MCLLCGTDWVFVYNSTFCPHSVFMCFVWISEQTAIISLYNINWLVCITETVCVYCAVRTGSLYTILRSAHTVYLCVLCGSQNKQRLLPYTALTDCLLGAFVILRKATINCLPVSLSLSLCPSSVRPSAWTNSASTPTDFHEILYLHIFRKSVVKIQVSLKSDNNNGYFTWRPTYIYDISLNSSYNEKFFGQNL